MVESKTNSRSCSFFLVAPRIGNTDHYLARNLEVGRFCEKNGFAGVLLFASGDANVEPWTLTQHILAQTATTTAIVAVNPAYLHPLLAAKLITSVSMLYNRKLFVNLITGTNLNDLHNIDDTLTHDQRYDRLNEFAQILQSLLFNRRPTAFSGMYYKVRNLHVKPNLPPQLLPEFLVAGQSSHARQLAAKLGCVRMMMLPPNLAAGLGDATGINFGLVTRPTREEAWHVANRLFPTDEEGQLIQQHAMRYTDSSWKRSLFTHAYEQSESAEGYWLQPFMNYLADCPFFVGSYDDVQRLLRSLRNAGVKIVILDVQPDDDELEHVAIASSC